MALQEASSSNSGDSNTGSVKVLEDTTLRKVSDGWKYFNKSADKKKTFVTKLSGTKNLRDHL